MLTCANWDVFNFGNALRGMRNPMNSWDKQDSFTAADGSFIIGEQDLTLAKKLRQAGSDHRKFLRQIFVSVDICAPLYWWKEFDTYKVATVANSTSTMHKIHAKPFELADFSCDKLDADSLCVLKDLIAYLEKTRLRYLESKEKADWYLLIQLLPAGYNQLRTCTLNYESLIGIYAARKQHKLDEWKCFCGWIESLPYANDLICGKG